MQGNWKDSHNRGPISGQPRRRGPEGGAVRRWWAGAPRALLLKAELLKPPSGGRAVVEEKPKPAPLLPGCPNAPNVVAAPLNVEPEGGGGGRAPKTEMTGGLSRRSAHPKTPVGLGRRCNKRPKERKKREKQNNGKK